MRVAGETVSEIVLLDEASGAGYKLLADFLLAKVVRKGKMDRAKCVEFWGREVDACDKLP